MDIAEISQSTSDLEAKYPKFSEKIKLAREYGYSDEEIDKYFRKKISEAFRAGYSAEEINEYLGIKSPQISQWDILAETAKETGKALWEGVKATPEVALSMATGAIAYPLSVLGGIAKNITSGPEGARKTEEEIARAFTYVPTSEVARGSMELLGKGMEFIATPARKAGKALEKIGLPEAGYSTEKVIEFITFGILGKVLPKIGKGLNEIDIPLTKQKIGEALKAGYSEEKITKYLEKNPQDIPLKPEESKPLKPSEVLPEEAKPIERAVAPEAEIAPKEAKPVEVKPVEPQIKATSQIPAEAIKEVSKPGEELKTAVEPKEITKVAPKEAKPPKIPGKEKIDELFRTEDNNVWTDGKVLVKGKPPKKAVFLEKQTEIISKKVTDEILNTETQPADFNRFQKKGFKEEIVKDPILNRSRVISKEEIEVSDKPMSIKKNEMAYAVFRLGDLEFFYDQKRFNVIHKRFSDAEYGINPETGFLIAYKNKNPVAALVPHQIEEIPVKEAIKPGKELKTAVEPKEVTIPPEKEVSKSGEELETTVEPKKVTKVAPKKAKPFIKGREKFNELLKTEDTSVWADGKIVVKGEPPKNAVFSETQEGIISKKATNEVLNRETQPAEFNRFQKGFKGEIEVSDKPIPVKKKDIAYAVFRSGNLEFYYDQNRFNVIRNRFPDAEYGINPEKGTLIAYKDKNPVAALAVYVVDKDKIGRDRIGIPIEESPVKEAIKSGKELKTTELHAGVPINKVWESWMAIDRGILGNFIHKVLDDTAVDRFIRRFADTEGMRYLPLKNKDNLLKAIYGPEGIKGKIGKGERITREFLDTLGKETQKGLNDAMFIRYMEDPKYRMAFDKAYPDNPLKVIQEDIKTASENLVREGIVTASQHKAWGDRYLSRVYLTLQEPSEVTGGIRKIKAPEIKKGRKIESIMDAPKQLRDELGFVEDAKTLLPVTRFKQYMPSAVNAFAKGVIKDPVMVYAKDNILVKLPEGVNKVTFEGKPLNFPEYMSPYYAKKVILPAIRSLVKEEILKLPKEELKAFIDEIKTKSKALETLKGNIPSDYVFMPEAKGYGNLAGLPVSKEVQNVVQSLRVIQNPAELATKLDKYITTGLATFKVMKVPFALSTAIMRNFLSNFPQWVVSGANPIAPFKEIPKAIKDIVSKTERWKKGADAGLFKSNWFDSEVLRIFEEMAEGIKKGDHFLKVWSDIMRSKPVELVGKVYGAMDDVWRMARLNYAMDVEKMPITEAVIKANKTHYDYSLTYALIQAMRDPNILKSPAWKILGSVFPTFSQKTLGLLYQAFKDNPITTTGSILLPYIIKEMVEEKQRRKYGKKYDILSESIPDWQKDPDTVTIYDPEEKKLKVVHLDWLLPWGQWVSLFEAATKGNIKEAIQDVGGISSPLLLPFSLMRNEDIYTGREIYDPTQSQLKQVLQILGYTGEKVIEPGFLTFLRRVFEQKKSPTEITLRSMGIPYFEYNEKDLMLIPAKKIGKLRLDINMRVNKLTNNLQRGLITKEEFAKELKRLYEYQKEEMKKIVEPFKSKKEEE